MISKLGGTGAQIISVVVKIEEDEKDKLNLGRDQLVRWERQFFLMVSKGEVYPHPTSFDRCSHV